MAEDAPMPLEANRKIIHIDMDAFFASVEQRDRPELRGKPIAVGGSGGRGVVAACSYEARKYGVRSAMPSITAARLCPDLIFVRHRMDAYKEASRIIHSVFHRYTDLVEPLSIDEAYLDVTENKPGMRSAIAIAQEIRKTILQETALTATAGVSYNKFLAKMASGYRKPDSLNFIPPERALEFIDQLPIQKFYGIGERTAERMTALGVRNGADLRAQTAAFLQRHFGKVGQFYYQIARGIDLRVVTPFRPTRSVSVEDTFGADIGDWGQLDQEMDRLVHVFMRRLGNSHLQGRTLTVKVKYADFMQVTRSESPGHFLVEEADIAARAKALMRKTEAATRTVRLLGVGVSNFANDDEAPEEVVAGQQLRFDFDAGI